MIRALMWKEWKQQRVLYGLLLAATWVGLTAVAATRQAEFLGSIWLIILSLVTILLAGSTFSSEHAGKTEQFLKYLPIKEVSLFWGKFMVTGILCCSFLLLKWTVPIEALSTALGTRPTDIPGLEQSMGAIAGTLVLTSIVSYFRLSPLLTVIMTGAASLLLIMWEICACKLFFETPPWLDGSSFSPWALFLTSHGLMAYAVILGLLYLISTNFFNATKRWRILVPVTFVIAYVFTSILPNIASDTYHSVVGMPEDLPVNPKDYSKEFKVLAPPSADGHVMLSNENEHKQFQFSVGSKTERLKPYQWIRSIDLSTGKSRSLGEYCGIGNEYLEGQLPDGSKWLFNQLSINRSLKRLFKPNPMRLLRWDTQKGRFNQLPEGINHVLGWYDNETVIAKYDGFKKTGLVNVTTGKKLELITPEWNPYLFGDNLVIPGYGLVVYKTDTDSGELVFAVCTPNTATPRIISIKGRWDFLRVSEITADGRYVLLSTVTPPKSKLCYHVIDLDEEKVTSLILPPQFRQKVKLLPNTKKILVDTLDGYALYDIANRSWKNNNLRPYWGADMTLSQVSPDEKQVLISRVAEGLMAVFLVELNTGEIDELDLQFQCTSLPSAGCGNTMAWTGTDHLLLQGMNELWMVSTDGTEQKRLLP